MHEIGYVRDLTPLADFEIEAASEFNPMEAMRGIRNDSGLQSAEKAFLWAAALRANGIGIVRGSLSQLARDAGYHQNTATRVFAGDNWRVTRYFREIHRHERRVDLWFLPSNELAVSVVR